MEKEDAFINFVYSLSKLSKCTDGHVAAILVASDFSQIYSIGINGGPMHQEPCLCNTGKYKCVHAEQNCLAKNSNFDKPKIMICTKQCCQTCAALIVNSQANIQQFWYIEDYHDNTGLKILQKAGIEIFKLTLAFKN